MNILVVRKAAKALFFTKQEEKITIGDINITILYTRRRSRKLKRIVRESASEYDFVCSADFKEINENSSTMMSCFPQITLRKIASRYGICLENETLVVEIDSLDNKKAEILSALALEVRFVIIITELSPESFDFLVENSGICPKVDKINKYCEKITVVLKEDFLIKYLPCKKTYYDIVLKIPEEFYEYFLPEGHMIFSEYIKSCPEARRNVKIRELMSK